MSPERSSRSGFPSLGIGLGLRAPHYSTILENPAAAKGPVDWFEATSENYFGIKGGVGARPLHILEKMRADFPIVLHGVSLSIGSTDPLNSHYIDELKSLADRIEPAFVSDHICWTGVDGENLHELLPLPYTDEALGHIAPRILRVQEKLRRKLVFENVSSYVTFAHSEMTEWEFLLELSRLTDCGLLLDVNNVYVNSVNHGFDPITYLDGLPVESVAQIHLAGHAQVGNYLIDTHDCPVSEPVWRLFAKALERFGPVPSMIERDANIPSFEILCSELQHARRIQNRETLSVSS